MVETFLNSFLNMDTFKEDFFSKKIVVDRHEIYPYYNLKIFYSEAESVASASINPLAIVIYDKNEDEYYLHLCDDSKKDDEVYINEILEKFVDFTF